MTELVITRGLPASGKTTYARGWVAEDPEGRVRVNRDDLRCNLYGIYWPLTYTQERTVTSVQHAAVRKLLNAGKSVIVDDTHLKAEFAQAWCDIADEVEVEFSLVEIDTPVEICVDRDDERRKKGSRSVGADAIRGLHERYVKSGLRKVTSKVKVDAGAGRKYSFQADDLPTAWLVDIDGTLAHMNGRSPFEWHRVGEDSVNKSVASVVRDLHDHHDIIIVSGRDSVCRGKTEKWLAEKDISYDALVMRAEKDHRKDSIIKAELFWNEIAPRWNVVGVLDDRNQVVEMWRGLGLLCLQVAEGNF